MEKLSTLSVISEIQILTAMRGNFALSEMEKLNSDSSNFW